MFFLRRQIMMLVTLHLAALALDNVSGKQLPGFVHGANYNSFWQAFQK